MAFARLEEGYESAMKDYYKKQVAQLKALITMLIGQLSKGDRQKVMTICTIDVHARDVVAKMIAQKVSSKHAGDPLSVGTRILELGRGSHTDKAWGPGSALAIELETDQSVCSGLSKPP